MSAAILLRDDYDGSALRQSRDPAGVFWRLRRSMMTSPARTRPGPVAPECRSCATGCSASTPRRPDTDIVRGRRRRRVANATSRRTRIIPVEPPLPPGYLIAEP